MKRILISQNETNDNTDYLIENGKILKDKDALVHYGRLLAQTNDWKCVYKDDFMEIRSNENQLILKSYCVEPDNFGSTIYYMYLIYENSDSPIKNTDLLLDTLEEDIAAIDRTIDRERTQRLVEHVRSKEEIKKRINIALIALLLVAAGITIYNIIKS